MSNRSLFLQKTTTQLVFSATHHAHFRTKKSKIFFVKTPYGKKRHYFNRLYSVDFQNFQNVLDKMVNATYNGNYHVNGNALQIKDSRLFRSSSHKMGVQSHTQISKPIFLWRRSQVDQSREAKFSQEAKRKSRQQKSNQRRRHFWPPCR